MSDPRELAFRYDLLIAPDWRERFDSTLGENIKLPIEGRFLDVNIGTGAFAIELAENLKDKGEVVGVDSNPELISIARAKSQIKKTKNVRFEEAPADKLPFKEGEFDVVLCDASLLHAREVERVFSETIRVTKPGGRVVLKLTTHGSFDEFFSIYWEALHDTGMAEELWGPLESLIKERITISDAEALAERLGLSDVESFVSKEEFGYEGAEEFFQAPLIADWFLADWLEIVPAKSRQDVLGALRRIIDRERNNSSFEVSIKATVISGKK